MTEHHPDLLPPPLAAALGGAVFATPQAPHVEDTIEELQRQMVEAHDKGEAIRATADAEHRLLSEDESRALEDFNTQFETLDAEVKKRERLKAQAERLAKPAPRVAKPAPLGEGGPQNAGSQQDPRITGGEPAGARGGTAGFRSLGEMAKAVRAARFGTLDARLAHIANAATTYGNEGTAEDGGFAVPPDFKQDIVKRIQAEESLLSMTDQQTTSSNKATFPGDSTTPWQTSGGILVEFEGEGQVGTQTKPKLDALEVKAHKLKALVPVTDEMLEDVPQLTRYLPGKVGDKFTSKINQMIVEGNGVGRPLGLMNAGSKVTVAKETGQAADTIKYENIVNMWSRLYAPLRNGAVWLINQDIEPQLLSMVVPGTTPSWPAYLPPGGLSASPYGMLMGRPVIPAEACSTLGDEGDIILTNLKQYLTVQKTGGMRQDVSIHLFFDQDITAFRFLMRFGGQSWWPAAVNPLKGSKTRSNIVTLADRA